MVDWEIVSGGVLRRVGDIGGQWFDRLGIGFLSEVSGIRVHVEEIYGKGVSCRHGGRTSCSADSIVDNRDRESAFA
ncbi:predicted protein [Histoplasma mississippiense (nom. inval.)]|uniref:predicted protein n=1 Tax=Ajellomyces capsulatus (strain NAm1 / WU24) TaxID=2059318 RepID=UPI000157BBCA|nr:predicted protein [Histoplasma mississippiense (nom. inval.)]EDN05508.1 predicted protein [Histoplasma mississippiense (nom. inval.)]